ncbi:MAG: tagatose 1,6-diphosphate aldolase [Chloroflexota bacterium]
MRTLSVGKIRGLQTTTTHKGIFTILAIDHRDSLRVIINPDDPAGVPSSKLTDIKLAIIDHIAPHATAVMLEPVYNAAQSIATGAMPGNVGFLSALEEQGYLGDPFARETTLLNGWSVEKAKRLGASGIKLLLFYHPNAGEAAERQERVVQSVITDCARHDIPLFLEPMSYSLDPKVPINSPEFAAQRRYIVIESVRRLGALGPDVLKIQFPYDASYDSDEALWQEACQELNETSPVPWALLSGGDPFDVFKAQVKVACEAGCSGFMVGRALWREVIAAAPSEWPAILDQTVLPRFQELADIAKTNGHSWQEKYTMPTTDDSWYRAY